MQKKKKQPLNHNIVMKLKGNYDSVRRVLNTQETSASITNIVCTVHLIVIDERICRAFCATCLA